MKRLILLFIFFWPSILVCQKKLPLTIESKWNEVDRLMKIKNYEQTLPILADIKTAATKNKDEATWLRAFLAESNVLQVNRTDDQTFHTIDQNFQKSIRESSPLIKDILTNFYASFLRANTNRYSTQSENIYIISSREKKDDIIDSLYQLSLVRRKDLQKESTAEWKEMFFDLNYVSLTPTLYNYFMINYLDFYKTKQNQDANFLKDLLEEVVEFNDSQGYSDASAYMLTQFEKARTYHPDFPKNYQKIIGKYKGNYTAFLIYELATYYRYHVSPDTAIRWIKEGIERYPNSPWTKNLVDLEEEISRVNIVVHHDLFIPSNEYSPIKLTLRNVDSLYIQVYNTTIRPNEIKFYKTKRDSVTFKVSLDASKVYEERVAVNSPLSKNITTIYKTNPMDYGRYTILLSNNKDFKDDGIYSEVAVSDFQVTDLFISASLDDEKDNYLENRVLLINRKTGNPYRNEPFTFYQVSKDEQTTVTRKLKTNAKGQFVYRTDDNKDISTIDDQMLYFAKENQLIDLYHLANIPEHLKENLDHTPDGGDISLASFLDRQIYRPGQTVYFKAILFDQYPLKRKVLENKEIWAHLKDANGKIIDSLKLTTNAFGSVNAEFKIPQTTLNGRFSIKFDYQETQINTIDFSVEEYKRPSFTVKLEKNKETYTHRDTAIFKGNAESYTGAAISNSIVKYTITISPSGPKYYKKVYVDTTYTDHQGDFALRLPLMNDELKKFKDFNIMYEVEVVNQTGEMHSDRAYYYFSTKPWIIQMSTPEYIEENKFTTLKIKTLNQNDAELKFSGEVKIYRIERSNVILPESKKDYFKNVEDILSTKQYKELFPTYYSHSEKDGPNRTEIMRFAFDTNTSNEYQLNSSLLPYGEYEIEALSIIEGDSIKDLKSIKIFDPKTKKYNDESFLTYTLNKDYYNVGDNVVIKFTTDLKKPESLFLIKETFPGKKSIEILKWVNGEVNYDFLFSEDHMQRKIHYEVLFVNENKIESFYLPIHYASNKESLAIKVETFRDKITPGQKEKWSFKIESDGDQKVSEVLASMYDSSLDVFKANEYHLELNSYVNPYPSFTYYNYLKDQFNSNESTYNLFQKSVNRNIISNQIPILRNYGLWNLFFNGRINWVNLPRLEFNDDASLDEVVVVGYSGQLSGIMPGVAVNQSNSFAIRGVGSITGSDTNSGPIYILNNNIISKAEFDQIDHSTIESIDVLKDGSHIYGSRAANGAIVITTKETDPFENILSNIAARTDLRETAFFLPTLYTDKDGLATLEFNSPEALTKWKVLLFAHNKDMNFGNAKYFTRTQKQLMVRPNLPRFFREGDEIVIKAEIQNLDRESVQGDAKIELINPINNEVINQLFFKGSAIIPFDVAGEQNGLVQWKINVPKDIESVIVKIIAGNEKHTDGEQIDVPILSDRILITDSEKIVLKSNEAKQYSINSTNKNNVQAKMQVQSNPIIEIISALDYLNTYPYECTEQLSSRWFSLKVVQYIERNYPEISAYFKNINRDSSKTKLESNMELSSIKTEEMPWLRTLESNDKKLDILAKLFNQNIDSELSKVEDKITNSQSKDGGFPWFDGGRSNTYISIRVLEIFGKVLNLDKSLINKRMLWSTEKLNKYLDTDSNIYGPKALSSNILDYLYARKNWTAYYPFNPENIKKLSTTLQVSPYLTAGSPAGYAAKAWIVNQIFGDSKESSEIKNRLQQEIIQEEEKGMYWKSNEGHYNSISLHAYLVEAYRANDPSKLPAITQWLFFKKESSYWFSTWQTVDALYALLIANNPKDFSLDNNINVSVNAQEIQLDGKVLGQVTKIIEQKDLHQDLKIEIKNNNSRSVYGGIYHQYFGSEKDLETSSKSLSIEKIFLVFRSGNWIESNEAKLGEKVKIRINIINDDQIDYVHLKDSRPSGVEPIYRPSGYFYGGRYYFSLKDASTNFFFDHLRKGRSVYEYIVTANSVGIFNSGVSSIECMYDPTVNARSANKVLRIVEP